MISGYADRGYLDLSVGLFERDPFKSVVAQTALITGYMRYGKVSMAERIFKGMDKKSSVTWNAMISGYVQNSHPEDAVKLFKVMIESKFVEPTPLTLTSALLGCTNLSALSLGRQTHQFVYKSPLYRDTTVGTS